MATGSDDGTGFPLTAGAGSPFTLRATTTLRKRWLSITFMRCRASTALGPCLTRAGFNGWQIAGGTTISAIYLRSSIGLEEETKVKQAYNSRRYGIVST